MPFMALQGGFTTDKPIQGKALSCMCLEGKLKGVSRSAPCKAILEFPTEYAPVNCFLISYTISCLVTESGWGTYKLLEVGVQNNLLLSHRSAHH